jgi:hypothetical protein
MSDFPVEDVTDRLETAVRVPRRALRLARAVDMGPGLVEEQERVRPRERQVARERAPDADASAIDSGTRGDDFDDRTWFRRGRVRRGMRERTRVSSTVIAGIDVNSGSLEASTISGHGLNVQVVAHRP